MPKCQNQTMPNRCNAMSLLYRQKLMSMSTLLPMMTAATIAMFRPGSTQSCLQSAFSTQNCDFVQIQANTNTINLLNIIQMICNLWRTLIIKAGVKAARRVGCRHSSVGLSEPRVRVPSTLTTLFQKIQIVYLSLELIVKWTKINKKRLGLAHFLKKICRVTKSDATKSGYEKIYQRRHFQGEILINFETPNRLTSKVFVYVVYKKYIYWSAAKGQRP